VKDLKNNFKKKILFISNNDIISHSLERYLKLKDFIIYKEKNPNLKKINNINLIILDDCVKNFEKILEYFETKKHIIPILVLLNKKNKVLNLMQNKIYLLKPLKIKLLYDEINNLIKNIEQKKNKWHLSKNSSELVGPKNIKIKLTEKEYLLIEKLIILKEKEIKKSALLRDVWGYKLNINPDSINTRVLETHISRIRKKLKGLNKPPKFVKNIKGYSLKLN